MTFARIIVLGGFLLLFTSGCNFIPDSLHPTNVFHELKPWRLWRLNRQPTRTRNSNFSVSDPIPAFGRTQPSAVLGLGEEGELVEELQ